MRRYFTSQDCQYTKKGDTVIHHDILKRCNEKLDDTLWDQNNKDTTGPNGNVFAHDDDFITVNNSKTHDENSRGQNIQADTPLNSLIFSSRQPVAVDDMKMARTGRKITSPSHLQDYMT